MAERPTGDQALNISAATKVTAAEKKILIDRYGNLYAALRVAVRNLLEKT